MALPNQGLRRKIKSSLSRPGGVVRSGTPYTFSPMNTMPGHAFDVCSPNPLPAAARPQRPTWRWGWAFAVAAGVLAATGVQAQGLPVSPQQKATAERVAQAGVPLSELAPNAPASHTVKPGDTLWDIAGLFLKSPWRWPELWGMNLSEIRNPHRIFPGQVLTLDVSSGRALLRTGSAAGGLEEVRVSPRSRHETLADAAIPTIPLALIEPFLTEAEIVDLATLEKAPRIVAAQEGRVLLSRGDRAYARSLQGTADGGLSTAPGEPRRFRVFRNATVLKDPSTRAVLGYEAQYVGRAHLVRGEALREVPMKDGRTALEIEPATIDIVATKEEIRAGDRLLPDAASDYSAFVPRPPAEETDGQIVSVHGNAVTFAGQSQVVVINRGVADGLEVGHVLALKKDGSRFLDRTDPSKATIRLPDERNGLLIVFRPFERLSYALVLNITDGVKVGDRFSKP